MIKSTLEKIEKLIKDKEYQLPELMMKLLSFLMHFAKKIEIKNSQYVALDLFADAYKLFKNFLIEEPFKLKKISAHQLSSMVAANNCLSQIEHLRDRFTKELAAFAPNDPIGRKTVSELMDLKWVKKCSVPLSTAESKKAQIQEKKGKANIMNELAVLFWYGALQGQYLVHIDLFAQKLLDFLLEYLAPFSFLDKNGVFCLKEVADPDHKYFLTASSCEDLFLKIRIPEVIERLWQNSQEKITNEQFVSQSSMILRVSTLDLAIDQILGVTGQKLIMPGGLEKDVKLPPAVTVGSSQDCDIVLKNKYISRKQMLIIEEVKSGKIKEQDTSKHNFSIVCLSQTNFTIISYPHEIRARVGLIFYGQIVKYQIVKCEKVSLPQIAEDQDEDRTLSILPSEKISNSQTMYQRLTLLILSGEDREKEVTFSNQALSINNQTDVKHNFILKEALTTQQQIHLKPQTRILCKTSNDILQGKISRKIRLRKGLKIFVEDYVLNVE